MHWFTQAVLLIVYFWACATLTFVVWYATSGFALLWLGIGVAVAWILPVLAYQDMRRH